MPSTKLKLYIWPGAWGLPSIDAQSLAAALYVQLAAPGKFALVESADADSAPLGQLPYLEYPGGTASGLEAIIQHFNGALDSDLSPQEASTACAWRAFVDSELGILLAHSLFAVGPNYFPLTRNTLAAHLPVPQRYYVPGRLRELYRPRLEERALWDVGYEDKGEAKPNDHGNSDDEHGAKIRTTFGRERVREKAHDALAPLARLVSGRSFAYQERPTSLDLLLAAHILLLVDPPYPENVVGAVINDTPAYLSLVSHARLILSLAYPTVPGPNHLPPQIIFAPPPTLSHMPMQLTHERPWLRFASYTIGTIAGILAFAQIAQMRSLR